MTSIFIPVLVGLVACPFLGINPLKVMAGLAVLWLALFVSTL
jgi:hypothetical protein